MKWVLKKLETDETAKALANSLAGQDPFPLPLARVLMQRGITSFEAARQFFVPEKTGLHNPWLMMDMGLAVDRIVMALEKGEKILIYGDYDVDGTTSVSLMKLFFQNWGCEVDFYIPDRYSEGYGISFKGIDKASIEGVGLILALDCGTKSPDKVRLAKERGIDFIICDHHQTGGEHPGSLAFLNPLRQDCSYPFKDLSACGIGLKLIQALNEVLSKHPSFQARNPHIDPLDSFCDLVTLSIASDLVPIRGENRIIAWLGLEKIRKNPLPGIASLMQLSQGERQWDIGDLVFFIGPMINSAGRLNHARGAVDVLMGDHLDPELAASLLEQSNTERKVLDKAITNEAIQKITADPSSSSRSTTLLYNPNWHKGVIGIVASRVIEHYYKPTILLTRSEGDLWVGSGRSIHDFDLYEALTYCAPWLVQFGGHKYAAGLSVKEENLEKLREAFEGYGTTHITPDQKEPLLEIADELDFAYINPKFIRLLKRFSPFGPGNSEPVFIARGVEVRDMRILQDEHVRFQLFQKGISFEAIGFGLAHRWQSVNHDKIDVAYQPDVKTWNGVTSVQIKLKDFRKAN